MFNPFQFIFHDSNTETSGCCDSIYDVKSMVTLMLTLFQAMGLKKQSKLDRMEDIQRDDFLDRQLRRRDQTPYIYICATMWHESKPEMIQMLKSIFK